MEQLFGFGIKLIIFVLVVGNAAYVLTYVFYNAWKGKKHLAVPQQDVGFSEKWVSGFSSQGTLAGPKGSPNCLAVEVSKKALVIRVMFPFNLQAMPQIYGGLENYIPREKIKSIRPVGNDGGGKAADGSGAVLIEFETASGEQTVELSLKRRDEFFRAVGAAFGRQPVPSGIFT